MCHISVLIYIVVLKYVMNQVHIFMIQIVEEKVVEELQVEEQVMNEQLVDVDEQVVDVIHVDELSMDKFFIVDELSVNRKKSGRNVSTALFMTIFSLIQSLI